MDTAYLYTNRMPNAPFRKDFQEQIQLQAHLFLIQRDSFILLALYFSQGPAFKLNTIPAILYKVSDVLMIVSLRVW